MSSFNRLVDVRDEGECARLAERFQSAYPFPHVCIDGFFKPEFIARLVADFPAAGTPEYDRFCAGEGDGPRRNYANSEPATFPPAFRELDAVCGEPEFLDYLSRTTGIPGYEFDPAYFGAGIRESSNGAMLPPHLDFNYHPETLSHRRLNFLLYLNQEWKPEWGGNIEVHLDPNVHGDDSRIAAFAPMANRVFIFETSETSWHAFDRIRAPEGFARRAWSIYYYTRDREGAEEIKRRNTEYVEPGLPPEFAEGHVLDAGDVRLLQEMLQRRDSRIAMLYELRRTFEPRYSHLWNEYKYYLERYQETQKS